MGRTRNDRLNSLTVPHHLKAIPRWQGAQHRIGLTGGIASGKSSVARYLTLKGIPVLDADIYAHEALAPGSRGAEAVLARYGARVEAEADPIPRGVAPARAIDRRKLGRIIFSNRDERRWLEDLIHPCVRSRFERELAIHEHDLTIVLMIPLLFETALTELCSEIWVVDCSREQQLERLKQRNGLTTEEAEARIKAQWPLSEKCNWADLVINNRSDSRRWEVQINSRLSMLKTGKT